MHSMMRGGGGGGGRNMYDFTNPAQSTHRDNTVENQIRNAIHHNTRVQ